MSQTSATAGGAAFTLTVTGSNFVSGSVVRWNTVALTTVFVSSTQLTATVPASDIATAGTASVTVFNPTPGGGASTALTFTIVDFTASSTTPPQTVAAGQPATFAIATAPVGGVLPNPVTFTATGLPTGATATFNPPAVTPGTSTTMTVTTTPRTAAVATPRPFGLREPWFPGSFPEWLASLALAMLLAGVSLARTSQKPVRRFAHVTALVLLLVTVGSLAGCTGGFPAGTSSGTPAGIYTITVTGTSGTDAHSTTVKLTVH